MDHAAIGAAVRPARVRAVATALRAGRRPMRRSREGGSWQSRIPGDERHPLEFTNV